MSLINEIIEETKAYYETKGKPPKKLYINIETYDTFIAEIHERYSYFFAMNGDKDPLYFNGLEIIKIKNYRIG